MKHVTEQVKSAFQAKRVINALSTTEKNQLFSKRTSKSCKHFLRGPTDAF